MTISAAEENEKMADLIDRGKLVDYIMESYPDWCVKPIRPIFDFISGMPSVEQHGKWIPCKERLPDDGVNVLVQFIDGYTEICRLLGGCWEVLYGEYTGTHTAVAWMPLPEPYNGGDNGSARWEYVDYGGVGNCHCSKCRAIGKKDYEFCPRCGARMDG